MLHRHITRNGRTLRCGYTTGACAAGAAQAAARMLLTGRRVDAVEIDTPAGTRLRLDVLDAELGEGCARCAVRKDSGDDPDVTNGILVYATAEKTGVGIEIEGGEGVGRVTKAGLDQPVGAAAINAVPRRMIREQVEAVCAEAGCAGGIRITVSIPGGAELAGKTFNPRLGIVGGISVIGTTGIVEPMSSAALVDTIRLELRVLSATGARDVLLCPGNYGESFARDALGLSVEGRILTGNFIGDAVQAAVDLSFERILLVGHVGKLVKLGIGLFNTHSVYGDGRVETLIACALESGAGLDALKAMLDCATTDAALDALADRGLLQPAMAVLGGRIQACLERWVPAGTQIGFVCFTNNSRRAGVLAQSANAEELMRAWRTPPDRV